MPVGTAALADEAFVTAWGELPRDPLTFAGAVRFSSPPAVEAGVAPPANRLTIRQSARLRILPGRVGSSGRTWPRGAQGGRPTEAVARIPAALRLARVEGDGLTHWSRPTPERLRLRFDGAGPLPAGVRLFGWLDVESGTDVARPRPPVRRTPLADLGRRRDRAGVPGDRVRGPLPRGGCPGAHPGAAARPPGVACPAGVSGRGAGRVGPVALDAPGPAASTCRSEARWTGIPGAAEWRASVHCRITGGPCATLRLKLPAAWADAAEVRVEGGVARVTSAAEGGSVTRTIRPEVAAWDTLGRRNVRAIRPAERGGVIDFPDLVPLGPGSVETLLGLADASGWGIAAEGSPGLQPVPVGRFATDGPAAALGPPRDVYLVKREGWSLRVRAGEARALGGDSEDAVVEEADLTCVLRADGGADGEVVYHLGPRPGPFLFLTPPAGASALGAAVDDLSTVPLLRADGLWAIPLGAGPDARRVALTWRTPPPVKGDPHAIDVPQPLGARPPTRLAVYTPAATVLDPSADWKAVRRGTCWGLDRQAEGLARRIAAWLGSFDRQLRSGLGGAGRRARRVRDAARGVERAVAWGAAGSGLGDPGGPPARGRPADRGPRRAARRVPRGRADGSGGRGAWAGRPGRGRAPGEWRRRFVWDPAATAAGWAGRTSSSPPAGA